MVIDHQNKHQQLTTKQTEKKQSLLSLSIVCVYMCECVNIDGQYLYLINEIDLP